MTRLRAQPLRVIQSVLECDANDRVPVVLRKPRYSHDALDRSPFGSPLYPQPVVVSLDVDRIKSLHSPRVMSNFATANALT